ncbi:hypothetical protein Ddc_23240 [Ditylenchus destructor]|nr:hypothetical protein Ddc_23240 [Ditylenchus destructor]
MYCQCDLSNCSRDVFGIDRVDNAEYATKFYPLRVSFDTETCQRTLLHLGPIAAKHAPLASPEEFGEDFVEKQLLLRSWNVQAREPSKLEIDHWLYKLGV